MARPAPKPTAPAVSAPVEQNPLCQTTVVTVPSTLPGGGSTTVTVYCDQSLYHEGPHGQAGLAVGWPKSIYNNK
jgi:hypothetical protein